MVVHLALQVVYKYVCNNLEQQSCGEIDCMVRNDVVSVCLFCSERRGNVATEVSRCRVSLIRTTPYHRLRPDR